MIVSSCDQCNSRSSCSADLTACPGKTNTNLVPKVIPEKEALHVLANVRTVVGICSGKGGVGKSMITSLTAVALARTGLTVGILDADVTGPSIPKLFGLSGKMSTSADGIFPVQTHTGIQIVSINLMLDNPDEPVIWRGPVISSIIRQFWSDVIWDHLDILLIDMPPGTGDVPLTVFQSIPLDGVIMVSTPQDLVALIVRKARNMALMMNVRILGFIENMSYLCCPDCQHEIRLFGRGHTKEAAAEMNAPLLDCMPIYSQLTELADQGLIEKAPVDLLPQTVAVLQKLIEKRRY